MNISIFILLAKNYSEHVDHVAILSLKLYICIYIWQNLNLNNNIVPNIWVEWIIILHILTLP